MISREPPVRCRDGLCPLSERADSGEETLRIPSRRMVSCGRAQPTSRCLILPFEGAISGFHSGKLSSIVFFTARDEHSVAIAMTGVTLGERLLQVDAATRPFGRLGRKSVERARVLWPEGCTPRAPTRCEK